MYFDPTVLVDFSTFAPWSGGFSQNVEKSGGIFVAEPSVR